MPTFDKNQTREIQKFSQNFKSIHAELSPIADMLFPMPKNTSVFENQLALIEASLAIADVINQAKDYQSACEKILKEAEAHDIPRLLKNIEAKQQEIVNKALVNLTRVC